MATLVFSTVGTIFGGPVGGAIGSLVGRQIDAALFGSANRQGPRLKELAVSTSSYGQPIPRHFGRMRVAGSIIWATELAEHSEQQGGGKGAPSVTTYSYSANFAVALSSRPIQGIGRIWADGKLLRGEEGDLKVGGMLRIYTGHGDQQADPLIVEHEGMVRCPAHRGLAYAVFEDLDLSEYYNHIPALTFEVFADSDFTLQDMVADLIDDIDADVALDGIEGFTCEASLAECLQTLDQVIPLESDAGGSVVTIARSRLQGAPISIAEPAIATADGDFGAASGFVRQRAPAAETPPSLLRYFDMDRDYLPGIQRASGPAMPGEPRALELPAALSAAAARGYIETIARRTDWSRDRISWRTQELDPAVSPGAVVALPDVPGQWRVSAWEWRESGLELSLERLAPDAASPITPVVSTDPGRFNPPTDAPAAQSTIIAFELPSGSTAPVVFAAVSATSPNWSGAALYGDSGTGAMVPLGTSGRTRSVSGQALGVLAPANPLLLDRSSTITIALAAADLALSPASVTQLANGANLALLGSELIQFAQAEPLGGGNWKLSGFLRGRGGTEASVPLHGPDEAFVLLDGKAVPLDPSALGDGLDCRILAIGRGDAEPATSPIHLAGITSRPPSPVHPRTTVLPGGSLRLEWTRRARGVWQWLDGVDVPLVEEAEAYEVSYGPASAPVSTWLTSHPRLDLAPDVLAALAAVLAGGSFRVRQRGTHTVSDSLLLTTLA